MSLVNLHFDKHLQQCYLSKYRAQASQSGVTGGKLSSTMGMAGNHLLTHHGGHRIGEAPLALAAYCFSSIAMTIMNKYVLSGHKFHLNFFLLMVQVRYHEVAGRSPLLRYPPS